MGFMTKSIHSMSESPTLAVSPSRVARETALNETRRALILDAARTAFAELGLDGASLREIAKRAGYTPGALYSYFASREDIYAALLAESLTRLQAAIDGAQPVKEGGGRRSRALALFRAQALAFFQFYCEHPQDLDLGFYLFNGAQPRGLTPELNQQLNAQLMACLEPMQDLLVDVGLSVEDAWAETTALFAHLVGVLILNNTGRIRLFRQDAGALCIHYLDALQSRLKASTGRSADRHSKD